MRYGENPHQAAAYYGIAGEDIKEGQMLYCDPATGTFMVYVPPPITDPDLDSSCGP